MSVRRIILLLLLTIMISVLVCSCGKMKNRDKGEEISTEQSAQFTDSTDTKPIAAESEVTGTTETESIDTVPSENNVPIEITVADAPADFYTYSDKYESCLHSESEYSRDVILIPSAELKGFKFFIYDVNMYMTENVCEVSEVLYTSDSVSPDRPFVARIWIPEFISSYGISYEDNGETVMLMFGESGMDGSVLLCPFS